MVNATRIFIGAASAVLFAVGGMLAFAPQALYHQAGGALASDIVLSSDIRSGGTLLLACAGFLAFAALRAVHLKPALYVAALAFLGYGAGRLVSFVLDGQMNATLVAITGVEWAIGLAALVLAWRQSRGLRRPRPSMAARPA